jgi:CheY-like chemotaxis protein
LDCHKPAIDLTERVMQTATTPDSPPDSFVAQVKETLEHLYDFAYLQSHPLAQVIPSGRSQAESAGQRLRDALLDAIESMDQGGDAAFRAPQTRLHNLLHLHYVETMTVQECAYELNLSERQTYRDLRRAEESVAVLLWSQQNARSTMPQPARATQLSSVQSEVDRITPHPCATDLWTLVERACKSIARLAEGRGIEVELVPPAQPVIIYADPILAQQVLTALLSQVVQQSQPGLLVVEVMAEEKIGSLQLRYHLQQGENAAQIGRVVAQLAERLGWSVLTASSPEAETLLSVYMHARGPTILVIDDNEGLVSLLERYLISHAYRVIPAVGGKAGLDLARELMPQAIVLDVIMPDLDGWEVLQALRENPATAAIPVIICSVFDDPGLATSLGASASLPKPISRADVLGALQRLGVV